LIITRRRLDRFSGNLTSRLFFLESRSRKGDPLSVILTDAYLNDRCREFAVD
jgi:hypothetical protein